MSDFPDCAIPALPRKGRGCGENPVGRFESRVSVLEDDGWQRDDDPRPLPTALEVDAARSVISRNHSPDVPFNQSVNPYRGCEHGCDFSRVPPTPTSDCRPGWTSRVGCSTSRMRLNVWPRN